MASAARGRSTLRRRGEERQLSVLGEHSLLRVVGRPLVPWIRQPWTLQSGGGGSKRFLAETGRGSADQPCYHRDSEGAPLATSGSLASWRSSTVVAQLDPPCVSRTAPWQWGPPALSVPSVLFCSVLFCDPKSYRRGVCKDAGAFLWAGRPNCAAWVLVGASCPQKEREARPRVRLK